MSNNNTLGELLGTALEDDFSSFDLTEINAVLSNLRNTNAIDIAHAEQLTMLALRGSDIAAEYIGKLIKTVSYLEGKVSSTKNKAALEYKPESGKATADIRRNAGEAHPDVLELSDRLARAKGAKAILEHKINILIKAHHYYKELVGNMRSGITSQSTYRSPKENSSNAAGEIQWGQ